MVKDVRNIGKALIFIPASVTPVALARAVIVLLLKAMMLLVLNWCSIGNILLLAI